MKIFRFLCALPFWWIAFITMNLACDIEGTKAEINIIEPPGR